MTYLNPGSPPAIQSAPQQQPSQPPRRRRKPPNCWVMPWILRRPKSDVTSTSDLINTDIPGYQDFVRLPLPFLPYPKCIHHHLKKSVTNFNNPLEAGLKVAIAVRHLASGENYTTLQYHRLVGKTTIWKFIPKFCQAILAEFQDEYLGCPDSSDLWKRVEEMFRTRWNIPNAFEKPKKTDIEYYSYKGCFPGSPGPGRRRIKIPVDRLWVNCGRRSRTAA